MALNTGELKLIIDGCAKNDRKSQQYLYKFLYGKMMAVCMRYTNNEDEAKDVLQEGFLKVFGSIGNYAHTGSFEGWVKRIMVNTSIDYYRKRKREKIVNADSDYLFDIEEKEVFFNEEEEELLVDPKIVTKEIQNLSPAYKTVFNMYVVEGYSHKEIAEELGISEGTSKSNLAKAKINLRKQLKKYINI